VCVNYVSYHSEEIQMIAPPHLIFVLSILTKDLTQRSTDVFLLPIISSRRIRHQKIHRIIRCRYYIAQRPEELQVSLQILHLLKPPSNSNSLHIICAFSRISAVQKKAEFYLNCISRRSFSKEAESSHTRQSSSEL
jgi:hypothetical protein